jgi:hypothetical protein
VSGKYRLLIGVVTDEFHPGPLSSKRRAIDRRDAIRERSKLPVPTLP